jgi:hypothetical protein
MCTMLLDALARLAIDAGAIGVLAFALYYPRHGRSDLAVLLCPFNLGVFLAVIVIVGGECGNALLPVIRHCAARHSATGAFCGP